MSLDRRESAELLIRLDENVQTLLKGQENAKTCNEAMEKRLRETETHVATITANLLTAAQEILSIRKDYDLWKKLTSVGVALAGIIGYVR